MVNSRIDIEPLVSNSKFASYTFDPLPLSDDEIIISKALAAANARVLASRGAQVSPRSGGAGVSFDAPPTNNMGGNSTEETLVLDDGKVLIVPARRGYGGDLAFVDWLNFTCHESSFWWDSVSVTDDQVIADVSRHCMNLFGFGITSIRDRGLNFYKRSYVLGDGFGFVCHGGQRNTVLIQLSGAGCTAAREGWEKRVQVFLSDVAQDGRITRVDLAYDDFTGQQFSADGCEKAFDAGLFKQSAGGRCPDIELRGNWKNPNGKGRTVNIGNRKNGKFFRGYEKGCQLGSPSSLWFRCEVEFKSVDRLIPFDCLVRPGEYLAAAYPALASISEKQERILTTQKVVEASYERVCTWLNSQCGAALNVLLAVEGSAEKVMSMLVREGKIPKGLDVPTYKYAGRFIHDWVHDSLPYGAFVDASFS